MLEPTLAKVLCYWAIFIVVNDQMLKSYPAIWSLCLKYFPQNYPIPKRPDRS